MVEIGKGSKVKYELDKKSGLIKVRFRFSYFHCPSSIPYALMCLENMEDFLLMGYSHFNLSFPNLSLLPVCTQA